MIWIAGGALFIAFGLFITLVKFFVAKGHCSGGASLFDGYVFAPICFTVGLGLIRWRANPPFWQLGLIYVIVLLAVFAVLRVAPKLGERERKPKR